MTAVLSHDDLLAFRRQLLDAFDDQLDSADDTSKLALRDLRQAAYADIERRLIDAPASTTRTPLEATPALVLAAKWYDDATRADEIIERNGLTHAGFVPPRPLRTLIE